MMIRIFHGVVLVTALIFSQNALTAILAGPDAYGHVAESIGFNLRDIQLSGTQLPGDDDLLFHVPIGFDYFFNGMSMDTIEVSINGFLIKRSGNSAFRIDGYSDDLQSYGPPLSGDIYYQTVGATGSREFVVGYYGVSQFPLGRPEMHMTFEIILHEGSNNIEYQYADLFEQNRVGHIGITYFPFNADDNLSISKAVGYQEHTGYLISEIPITAAVWLFGSGIAVLLGVASRRVAYRQ